MAARLAAKKGYTNIKVFHAGAPAWQESGKPLVTTYGFVSKRLDNVVLIDTRGPESAKKGHIQGAFAIALDRVVEERDAFPLDTNVPIILYGEQTDANNDVVFPPECFMKIEINGKERVPMLPCFNYYQDHQMSKYTEHGCTQFGPMYSFCLYPNRLTPSGSCNFSRIDNARLIVDGRADSDVSGYFYAINWNFLQIRNGTAGLLFAN